MLVSGIKRYVHVCTHITLCLIYLSPLWDASHSSGYGKLSNRLEALNFDQMDLPNTYTLVFGQSEYLDDNVFNLYSEGL